MTNSSRPLVGIPCDRRVFTEHAFHLVGEKYITAVRDGVHATPFLIPSLKPALTADEILSKVDGLLFTGSPSNVAPRRYGSEIAKKYTLLDEARDALTLELLPAAIEAGVPVLCICRGFQELNVAYGGTLHQHLHEVEGLSDHRSEGKTTLEETYGPAHEVRVVPGGLLSRLTGEKTFQVNSLHSQGIEKLAPGLRAEARAPDGVIEAVSMDSARGFLLAVQWHPEWNFAANPVSRAILSAFGEAVAARYDTIRKS